MSHLAIFHYHLNRGGVTQVIINQLRALDAALEDDEKQNVTLVYGGRRAAWPEQLTAQLGRIDLSLCELPALDYDQGGATDASLGQQLADLLASQGCAPQHTTVHVHNHSLGKNLALPDALRHLAQAGFALVLQIHDFVEDFRPDDYRRLRTAISAADPHAAASQLYPQAPHIHYAVLNDRDMSVLEEAGVPADRLHLLPNAVAPLDSLPPNPQSRDKLARRFGVPAESRYILYPVRGIRRKNVGEALLWSLLDETSARIGMTLPPLNPIERPSYERWKRLTEELRLDCVFDVGAQRGLSFAENMAAADLVLTTSVAEGFGMVFVESWLAGRPLIGRDLPEITSDFVHHGIRLDCLEPRFNVPVDWVGQDAFYAMTEEAYLHVLAAYGQQAEASTSLTRALEEKVQGGLIDFGDLNAVMQAKVIREVADSDLKRRRLADENAASARVLRRDSHEWDDLVASNAKAARNFYSVEPRGRQLLELYRRLAATPRDAPIEPLVAGERILERFLHPSRVRPIRFET